MFNRCDVIGL